FHSTGLPRGVVPLVPLRRLSLIKVFGRRVSKRAAIAFAAMMALALAGLSFVLYRSWPRQSVPAMQSASEQSQPAAPIKSIAVLPFKPLVADSRDEALE